MDEYAECIRELIAGTCVASQPLSALLHTRTRLLALAELTVDPEAADDACGAVAEIDAAVDERSARSVHRRAS